MLFSGFKLDYPCYDVLTPQSGLHFSVRSMTVAEVGKLKMSLVSPNTAYKFVNKAMYDSLAEKPEFIKDYDDFKKYVTTRDREAIMYGLYYTSFGDEKEFQTACTSCGATDDLKINMSDMFKINNYPHSVLMQTSYAVSKATGQADVDHEIEQSIAQTETITPELAPVYKAPVATVTASTLDVFAGDGDDGIASGDSKPEGLNSMRPSLQKTISNKPPVEVKERESALPQLPGFRSQPQTAVLDFEIEEQQKQQEIIQIKQNLLETINPNSILAKRHVLDLTCGIKCYIKQPTLLDEEESLTNTAFINKDSQDILNEIMIIDRFEQYIEGQNSPNIVLTNKADIIAGYNSLLPKDKIKIFEAFQKEFGQYGLELESKHFCKSCGAENTLSIDIMTQFFRMVSIS